MKYLAIITLGITLLSFGCNQKTLFAEESVSLVKGNFKFTEGPYSDREGNLYFSDILQNTIYQLPVGGEIKEVITNTGWGNGIFIDNDTQTLFYCQAKAGSVSKWSKSKGSEVVVTSTDEFVLNSPNDLWLDSKGGIYFSDPNYNAKREVEREVVFYFNQQDSSLKIVENDLVRPNGLVGIKGTDILYITDQGDNKTWKYKMLDNGDLDKKTLFASLGGDGMTADELENIYITNKNNSSVDIYSKKGVLLEQILVPEIPANAAFAGLKMNELYITARTSLYKIEMNVKGQ